MRSLENKDEETAFYTHDSNRAVAVLWPAIVENRLTDALKAYLRKDNEEAKKLFSANGPLGTFGIKIKLGYMLGLYETDLRDDLVLLTKIRNAFAHRVDISDFESSPIRDWMDAMTVLKVHRDLLRRLEDETKPESDQSAITKLQVLRMELLDYRNSFHLCIRFMIHKLVEEEKKLLAAQKAAFEKYKKDTPSEG